MVWSYNGQVPGPEIRITKGDTLKINFTNNLPQETVDLGLVPLDEGAWANHCHALEHAEAGMMTVVEVK